MAQKYVLDTSVILFNPHCLESFPNSVVIIHENVLKELDKAKTSLGKLGKNARVFIRQLDEISEKGNIAKGIKINKNTTVKVDTTIFNDENFGDPNYTDNKLLQCAIAEGKATIASRDISLRIRAKSFGCPALSFQNESRDIADLYQGFRVSKDSSLGEKLKKEKELNCDLFKELRNLSPNECVNFVKGDKTVALGREVDGVLEFIEGDKPWGLDARNVEQAMALDLLLDPYVPLVSLIGKAGCGKTLLAVAAGLECVIKSKIYDKLVIYRPIIPVGPDLGYMPGELSQKLDPWMGAIKDSLDFLSPSTYKKKRKNYNNKYNNNNNDYKNDWEDSYSPFLDKIKFEAFAHIRGRSISNAYIIFDESQNISKHDMKTLLTRVGENTKIVLTGDIEQIDHNNLDAIDNGLTSTVNAFKSDPLSGHITLHKGERSALATRAAEIL